jgi:hypothetical protein
LLEKIRAEEHKPYLSYQTVYIAIQLENQRLGQLGERTRLVASRRAKTGHGHPGGIPIERGGANIFFVEDIGY